MGMIGSSNADAAAAAEDEWLDVGAPDKAKSIELLASGLNADQLLEVGCGTGAVLERVVRSGIARSFAALEPSAVLCDIARSRAYDTEVEFECATLTESSFASRRFGLVVLTHVLEHVVDPARLLADCLERSDYCLVEVPLEGTIAGDFRAWIRGLVTRRSRMANSAGHIQFFSGRDVARLARWCGAEVMATRTYFPRLTYEEMAKRATGPRRFYYRAFLAMHRVLGDRVIARLYYGHHASLLKSKAGLGVGMEVHPLYWSPPP